MLNRRNRKNDLESEIRRGLDRLGRKADQCDRLLESLAAERRRNHNTIDTSRAATTYDTQRTEPLNVLVNELANLREGQLKMLQMIEKLQMELAEERRLRESLFVELRSRGLPVSAVPSAPMIQPSSTITSGETENAKYKELKKKLLMANLKILELQNAKSSK